jgi:FKBP-type peptidyl-prolyl cis-trans isomerase FklB
MRHFFEPSNLSIPDEGSWRQWLLSDWQKNQIAIFVPTSKMSLPKVKFMKITLLAVIFSAGIAAPLFADGTNVLNDERSKASYAIGMMLGHNWQQQGVDVDLDLVLRGLKDEQAGGATLMTQPEMQNTLKEFQQELTAKKQKMQQELAAKNKAEGMAFLATNKNNPGVVTLPDGLQYKVITGGNGAIPAPDSIVKVNYRGTFLDGTEFDSSAKAGHPIQLQVSHVIHGWTEALTQMKVGSKWQLFIPSDLAYGEQGNRAIPPNSTLIFDVELIDTEAAPPAASGPAAPLTSDIIKVPSAEEMKKGAKIETIKPEDVQKMQSQSNTN